MNVDQLKKYIYERRTISRVVLPVYHGVRRTRNFSSKAYWEDRYRKGGNSGAGSYGRLAQFKADVINDFIKKNKVKSVIEFGSGDGSQLKLFKCKQYTGFDVSKTSIALCKDMYADDKGKSFFLYDPEYFIDNHGYFSADLTMSLDVIYHLVEDSVFEKYMSDLFSVSDKYVIIYSSDTDQNSRSQGQHVRHRKFTDWVSKNQKNWRLKKKLANKHSLETNEIDESFANFFIYEKVK